MSNTPEIENILEAIVDICGAALRDELTLDHDRLEALVGNLSTNGWERHSSEAEPLSIIVKRRVKERYPEPAMHRGAALNGLVGEVQAAYDDASRWQATKPSDSAPNTKPPRTTTETAGSGNGGERIENLPSPRE